MLLTLLNDFAESRKLLEDLDNLAFSPKIVRWIICLDAEGNLIGLGPQETNGEKNKGMEYLAPQTLQAKNAGGIAEFLADNITSLFGLDSEPTKGESNEKQRLKRDANNKNKYVDFWRQIQEAFETTKCSALESMLKFHTKTKDSPSFLRWGTAIKRKPGEKPAWWLTTNSGEEVKLGKDNFTFSVEGFDGIPLIDETLLRPYWRRLFKKELIERDNNSIRGLCLVTGKTDAPIAETHIPKITSAPHIQSFGAAIVSFDKPSFSSYGFKKSYNAPTSTKASMAYIMALNFLLSRPDHCFHIGQTSLCFWARETHHVSSLIASMFNRPDPASVRNFMLQPWAGLDRELVRRDRFYSFTLSSNAGRIVIRHWLNITLEEAFKNFTKWFEDLNIVTYGEPNKNDESKRNNRGDKSMPPLALDNLACATVRDIKELQSEIPTQLYRAALEGRESKAPSLMLLKPILNRLNADLCRFGSGILQTPIPGTTLKKIIDSKTPVPPPGQSRTALLRMVLNRNRKPGEPMIEPTVFETSDEAYNCGRLLAILAGAQQKAHDYKLEGPGIAERYYGTASAAPSSVFPLLIRLNRHHLNKISKSEKYSGDESFIEDAIEKILILFRPNSDGQPPKFPRSLNLQAQGRFAIGFYQQQAADDNARRLNSQKNLQQHTKPADGGPNE